ncbi:MAG TPA: cytochrome c oxidase subunit I [Nitrolancea sp.]|nr:cytochrome c oxidase subunit I [Nitrolancea sp.]
MATVAERPHALPQTRRAERLLDWVTTTDHKKIGILYLGTTLVFFMIGGVEAMLMRIQLSVPNNGFLSPAAYNGVFTLHGTTMIFFVVVPMLIGFINYFLPLMIGARDMAFPRLNALSYWLLLFGGLLLYFSIANNSVPDAGWFAYAPLTEVPYTLRTNVDYWILGLLVAGFGTVSTGINIIVTVIKNRAPGMSIHRLPVFVWMAIVNAFLILWALPSLSAAQVMLLFDRHLNTKFFVPSQGGDAVLWQHLFWWFGHPEVYIMAIPAFGIISEVIPVFSRKPLFGRVVVIASGFGIGLLSFGVWAHHMFAVGIGFPAELAFGGASMMIAVPTGIKVFNWIATMWGGRIRLTTSMLFAVAFICQFTFGGITGIQFSIVPVDWQLTDSYYVVGHFHYVLLGGTLFAMFAGAYYWFPKMSGRLLSERIGKFVFWLMVIGFNLTFFPMHILGLMGMARRVATYPDLPWWGTINFIETIGAAIMGIASLLFVWSLVESLRTGEPAGDNPWNAWTLEWATTSPPPPYNFATMPPVPVHSSRPLWDVQHHPQTEPSTATAAHAQPNSGDVLRRARLSFEERTPTPTLGVLLLISSEVVFFGSLIAAYIEFRYRSPSGPGPGSLDIGRTALFSVALWASSITLIAAERFLRKDNRRAFSVLLLTTIVLGAVFMYGQITEFATMYSDNIKISTNVFTSAFFTLTGFHGAHVIIGLVMLIILLGMTLTGHISRDRHDAAVQSIAYYWHFVDIVWVVIFSIVYLWSVL